ncbi:hypothetical protein KCP71_00545 [Salmonella enterica subsp. enterica]|nr:hypothetical protein KCP71_00545 [Salmonella enterica subsp. enterica]
MAVRIQRGDTGAGDIARSACGSRNARGPVPAGAGATPVLPGLEKSVFGLRCAASMANFIAGWLSVDHRKLAAPAAQEGPSIKGTESTVVLIVLPVAVQRSDFSRWYCAQRTGVWRYRRCWPGWRICSLRGIRWRINQRRSCSRPFSVDVISRGPRAAE